MFRAPVCAFVAVTCLVASAPATAQAPAGRASIVVAPVEIGPGVQASAPDAADVLKREIEIALEATGLFTVQQTNTAELKATLAEMRRSGRPSARPIRAQYILTTTVLAEELGERRRYAPNNSQQDLVTVSGSLALRLTVMRASDAGVKARMSVDVAYEGKPQLKDPVPNGDYRGGAHVLNGAASQSSFVALSQAAGRLVANRVLDQVSPVVVIQRTGEDVFLSRGQDAGYAIGQVLRVMKVGSELRDIRTGEVLDRSDTLIGRVRVTEVRPRVSIARITQSSGEIGAGAIVREDVDTDQ